MHYGWAFCLLFLIGIPERGPSCPICLGTSGGVLVSDFYTAYDALDCPQQRCLVHLMRDFNEEMQRHPFDNELKTLAASFSTVLKSAVATIDHMDLRNVTLRNT